MKTKLTSLLRKNEAVSACLVIAGILLLSLTSPYFLQRVNLDSLQTAIAPYGIMSIGMMVLLISGVFDLSVGSVMCLGGLVTGICLNAGANVPLAILAGILAGTLVGLVNGLLVEVAGINALIATIGMQYIARGICEIALVDKGKGGYRDFPELFLSLGRGQFLGVYYMVWIMAGLMIAFQLYLRYAPSGRQLYHLGGNYAAARQMGIKNKLVRIRAFMFSGTLAALAGVLVTARSGVANRYTGENAHMDIIIACIIGGGSLAGGRGSIVGALFGMTFMKLMSNAFNLYTIAPQWQSIIVGGILLLVLAVGGYVYLSKQKKLGKI